jgi:AP-1 complex subunit gamma-1
MDGLCKISFFVSCLISCFNIVLFAAHHLAGGTDMLLDLLSLGGSTVPPTPCITAMPSVGLLDANPNSEGLLPVGQPSLDSRQPAQGPSTVVDPFADLTLSSNLATAPGFPRVVGMETDGLKVTFDFTKPPGCQQTTVITASYYNLSSIPYTDFVFQAAVPKFLQLQLEPATSSTLPASGSGSVTQVIRLTNSMHKQKALVMKMKVTYKCNGQIILEQGQVNNFPAGL